VKHLAEERNGIRSGIIRCCGLASGKDSSVFLQMISRGYEFAISHMKRRQESSIFLKEKQHYF